MPIEHSSSRMNGGSWRVRSPSRSSQIKRSSQYVDTSIRSSSSQTPVLRSEILRRVRTTTRNRTYNLPSIGMVFVKLEIGMYRSVTSGIQSSIELQRESIFEDTRTSTSWGSFGSYIP